MKNKNVVICITLVIVIIAAIGFAVFKAKYNNNYLYNKNGTITDGKVDIINHLKSIENTDERRNQIDFSVKQNIITQQEANELY